MEISDEGALTVGRGTTLPHWIGWLVALVFVAWGVAYFTGAFPWIGHKGGTWRRSASGFPTGSGSSENSGTVYLFSGQTLILDYKTTIQDGGELRISVFHPPKLGKHVLFEIVRSSAEGRFSVPVSESGFYTIEVSPFGALREGASVAYDVWWGGLWNR